jgi:nucleotide-binding universal stress UspA family protein
MKAFSKILCPVDFSPCSRLTAHYARQLAQACASQLIFLHVKPVVTEIYETMVPELAAYVSRNDQSLNEVFNDFAGDWAGKHEKIIAGGLPHEEILRLAEQTQADVIVMGAKGLSRVERYLLGGTTEKVVRRARCAVLTVHDGDPHLPAENILFPTDLSDYAHRTWPLVAELARLFKAKVHVAHIIDLPQLRHQRPRDESMSNFGHKLKVAVREQLQETFASSGVDHEIVVVEKQRGIGPGLTELVDTLHTDLIVMPAHGKNPLAPPFIGGVTERVVRMAHCPVLTVRHHQ